MGHETKKQRKIFQDDTKWRQRERFRDKWRIETKLQKKHEQFKNCMLNGERTRYNFQRCSIVLVTQATSSRAAQIQQGQRQPRCSSPWFWMALKNLHPSNPSKLWVPRMASKEADVAFKVLSIFLSIYLSICLSICLPLQENVLQTLLSISYPGQDLSLHFLPLLWLPPVNKICIREKKLNIN